jgi:hypothetical protein
VGRRRPTREGEEGKHKVKERGSHATHPVQVQWAAPVGDSLKTHAGVEPGELGVTRPLQWMASVGDSLEAHAINNITDDQLYAR